MKHQIAQGFNGAELHLEGNYHALLAFHDAAVERVAQDVKWGEQNHTPLKWMCILMEEVGEAASEVLALDNPEQYRQELVQCAAVALAAIESFDRQETT